MHAYFMRCYVGYIPTLKAAHFEGMGGLLDATIAGETSGYFLIRFAG